MKLTDRAKQHKKPRCFLKALHFPKQTVEDFRAQLFAIELHIIHTPNPVYEDIWHNASLLEAADTRAKRDFIAGRMSLDRYMAHERTVYGTINC